MLSINLFSDEKTGLSGESGERTGHLIDACKTSSSFESFWLSIIPKGLNIKMPGFLYVPCALTLDRHNL